MNKTINIKYLTQAEAKTYFESKYPNVDYDLSEVTLVYRTFYDPIMSCCYDVWYLPANELTRQVKICPQTINSETTNILEVDPYEQCLNSGYYFFGYDDELLENGEFRQSESSVDWIGSFCESSIIGIVYYRFVIKDSNKHVYINSAFGKAHTVRCHEVE
ncbi:MAG: hypothetical protein Terrestrivirus8_48 [Terrestrivirus sp.]|uniref:Uncharacterized protein n=1 Tax=Terrestrivirus sp. TaxID=2487775 RepID=A0A3G4ZNV4_9VIRU|nr:MAG: hypothetical protein Terrestrivirus8_48 [Terrestrivirus sp.]